MNDRMTESPIKTAGKRPVWKRALLLTSLLVIMSAVAASGYWLAGRRVWTDGQSLRMPASDAKLREVLWTHPQPIPGDFNTEAQEYEPSLSPDGQELYFVRGKPAQNGVDPEPRSADIFVSYRKDNAWTQPVPLDDVNSKYDDLGPRLTADGKYLLFYSDRPGSVGGYDVWAAPRTEKGFGPAFNLGPSVNSEFNDFSPAPTPDGKRLFFASNRKAGFEQQHEAWKSTIRQTGRGDYDLYVANLSETEPTASAAATTQPVAAPATAPVSPPLPATPSPLKTLDSDVALLELTERTIEPQTQPVSPATQPSPPLARLTAGSTVEVSVLNTPYHEGTPCVSPNGDFLYFSSNRPGGFGRFDLYRVRIHGNEFGQVENLGREVNTAENETDPNLAMGGFLMYFSSDRARPGAEALASTAAYDLFSSESHEVYPDRQSRPIPKFGVSAWVLLAALLALVPLLLMFRGWNDGRLNLFQKCLLVSVLIHVLLTILFSAAKVSSQIVTYVKQQSQNEITVTLTDAGGGGASAIAAADVSSQARQQLTETNVDIPEPSAVAQQSQPEMELPKASDVAQLNVPLARPDAGAMQVQVEPPKATLTPQPETSAPQVTVAPPKAFQPAAPQVDVKPMPKVEAAEQTAEATPGEVPTAQAMQTPVAASSAQAVRVDVAPAAVQVGASMVKPADVGPPSAVATDVASAAPAAAAPAPQAAAAAVTGPKIETEKVASAAPSVPAANEGQVGVERRVTGEVVGEAAAVRTNVPQASATSGSLASSAAVGRQQPQPALELADVKPMIERGGADTIPVRPPTTQPLRKVEQTGPTIAGVDMPTPQVRTAPVPGASEAGRAVDLPQTASAPVKVADAAGAPIASQALQATTRPAGVAEVEDAPGARPSATTQPSAVALDAAALATAIKSKSSRISADSAAVPGATDASGAPQRQQSDRATGGAKSVASAAPAVAQTDAAGGPLDNQVVQPTKPAGVAAAMDVSQGARPSPTTQPSAVAPDAVALATPIGTKATRVAADGPAMPGAADNGYKAQRQQADVAAGGAKSVNAAAPAVARAGGASGAEPSLAAATGATGPRAVDAGVDAPAASDGKLLAAASPSADLGSAIPGAAQIKKVNGKEATMTGAEAPGAVASRAAIGPEVGTPGAIQINPSVTPAGPASASAGGSRASLATGAGAAQRTLDVSPTVAAAAPGKPIEGVPFALPGGAANVTPLAPVASAGAPGAANDAPAAVAGRAQVTTKVAGPDNIDLAAMPAVSAPVPGAVALGPDAAIGFKPRVTDAANSGLEFEVRVGAPRLSAPPAMFQRSAEQRKPLLEKMGGTKESEEAVERALAYLARNQEGDGHWTRVNGNRDKRRNSRNEISDHDPALTGLSVLAFLAGDHTPTDPGPYQDVVARGLEYLLTVQKSDGDLRGKFAGGGADNGNMYDHGIATFALAEAALMTGDKRYAEAAFKGCDFILKAQNRRTGGWRYTPGETGDTSVFGWQVMALHSAEQAGYSIPPECRQGMHRFIEIASSGKHRALGGYQPGSGGTPSMTAELLFCRIMLDQEITPQQQQEVSKFLTRELPERGNADFYCWYYGSLSLIQLQNDAWKTWNERTRETLISMQTRGGDNDGMFDGNIQWRGQGGRIFTTALGALTLEVYYRYLPQRAEMTREGAADE